MIKLLAKFFIKDSESYSLPKVRTAYGLLCGIVGIALNILLFTGKFIAGSISGSIAITADAFNNLSDAGSSVVSILGFKLAEQNPDSDHPFGHGRFEYIAGFIVSVIIVVMGIELGKSSVEKIINPEKPEFSLLILIILAVSIAVKLYMFFYNRTTAKKVDSVVMKATAFDSLSDVAATSVVLLSNLASHYLNWVIDGWCGVAVAGFILLTGIKAARETISPLLGQPPERELIEKIEQIVLCRDEILGIHDLVVHNYGPGRIMISLHAEVSSSEDILLMHDTIDNIERELKDVLNCEAVIHMDPISVDDPQTHNIKELLHSIVNEIDATITLHDFRIVTGPTHTNVIFDAVLPYKPAMSEAEFRKKIAERLHEINPNLNAVIQIDRPYV